MAKIGRVFLLASLVAALNAFPCDAGRQSTTSPGGSAPQASKKVPTSASGSGSASSPASKTAAPSARKPQAAATAPVPKPADPNVVACHALESHTNTQPAVTIVVFNQRDKPDHERLSDLLKENEGASVEVKTSDGKWHTAAVARLKSCFGRGVLFLSGDPEDIKEHDNFVLRFPAKKTS